MYEIPERCEAICTPEQRAQCVLKVASIAGQVALGQTAEIGQVVIETRDYQVETWQAIDNARQQGKNTALVHLATGLGKTTVAVVDALRYIDEQNGGGKVCGDGLARIPRILFACNQNEILDQAAERFAHFAPGLMSGSH